MGKHKSHKRKRSSEDEEIYSLFKKLKRKIRKKNTKESETENEEEAQEIIEEGTECEVPLEAVEEATAVEATAEEATAVEVQNIQPLDDEILNILGEDPNKKTYSESIHKDIAARWKHISCNGLEKEVKTDLGKLYPLPENCLFLEAPKLNPEVKAAVSEQVFKRDKGMKHQQSSLGQVTACVGKALDLVIKAKEKSKECPHIREATKILSDTGRMMYDLFYAESMSRRYLLQFALNKSTKDIVIQTQVGKNLFGDNLHEELKAGKAINKTGSEIKYSNVQSNKQGKTATLNSRGPPRRFRPQLPPSAGNQFHKFQPATPRWQAPQRWPAPQRWAGPQKRNGPPPKKS